MKNVSVILPAYNEEKNIGKVIKSVKQAGDYEIIVVDDGSKDRTTEVAKKHGCMTLRLGKNMGKGYACTAGAKIASHDNLVFIDSDNQLDAGEIPKMLRELRSSDLVVGTRLMGDIPVQRRVSNGFARVTLSTAAGEKFGDVLCGFRAIRKGHFFGLSLRKKRYEFESEMIIKAVKNRLKIKEVPVTVRYGIGSSMPVKDSLGVAAYLIKEAGSSMIR